VSGPLDTAIAALTDEQRLAVEHPGNFSLLARPGSGKTRVVGLRLARAAVTRHRRVALASYTNVAVEEVHVVAANAGVVLSPAHYVGTLHGLLLDYVVKPHGHLVLPGNAGRLRIRSDEWGASGGQGWPTIALDDDGKVRIAISYFDWTVDGQVICRRRPPAFHYATTQEVTKLGAAKARELKAEQLRRRCVITQADAMHIALRVLRLPRLAGALARRFDELIIDEAQDSSDVQLACVQLLRDTGALRSLVMVADLEQSIYSFQGADPAGCERLIDDCGLAPLSLTRNFRSSQRICDVASHFTRREEADVAAGPHADCPIVPEILRFPVGDPGAAISMFTERLELHDVDAADAVVLSRSRSLRDKDRPRRRHGHDRGRCPSRLDGRLLAGTRLRLRRSASRR
jgi:DNA helicase-2/ATP-dependent DNA helicase PcrA